MHITPIKRREIELNPRNLALLRGENLLCVAFGGRFMQEECVNCILESIIEELKLRKSSP